MQVQRWTWITAAMLVVAIALSILLWRASTTPEWAIYLGDSSARIKAAQSIWQKDDARATRGLRRLLADADPAVRLAALEALSRHPLPGFQGELEALLAGPDPNVAMRAAECMLASEVWDHAPALGQVETWAATPAWRADNARLLGQLTAARLDAGGGATWVLAHGEWLASSSGTVPDPVQAVLLSRQAALAPDRESLLERLDAAAPGSPEATLTVGLLTAIDGRMSGHAAADWRQDTTSPQGVATPPLDRFTVEAEWAFDLKPNFQIDTFQGEQCVTLGEGAGGYMSWLSRDKGTVDIGSGRFRFTLKTPGTYRLWARTWLENKCSNSTGMIVDGRDLGSFDDGRDEFNEWLWTPHQEIRLEAGPHVLEMKALEDGVHVDKYAFLPVYEKLNPASPPPLYALYDAALTPSLSFTMPMQHMLRGTTQPITVWVRRATPELAGGTVTLELPPPFELLHGATAELRFPAGSPVARTTFQVRLPADASAGEVTLRATLRASTTSTPPAEGETEGEAPLAEASVILGAHYDWWCSGAMPMGSARAAKLLAAGGARPTNLGDPTAWARFPTAGYDPYRRLNFESAYGQSQGTIAFLYTEIEVAEAGRYTSLLTSDDKARIWIDGKERLARKGNGPAEGNLRMEQIELSAGRHQIFVSVDQADFADPVGEDRLRHSPNYWVFKWLLRKDRHEAAPGIRGLLVSAGAPGAPAAP